MNSHGRDSKILRLFICLTVFAALPAMAAEHIHSGIQKEAVQALQQIESAFLKASDYAVQVERVWKITGEGLLVQYTTQYQVAMKRPNKFFVKHAGGFRGASCTYDGQTLLLRDPMRNNVETIEVDGSNGLDNLRGQFSDANPENSMFEFLLALASQDPMIVLLEGIKEGKLADGGQGTRIITLVGDAEARELTIGPPEAPLPIKLSIQLKQPQQGPPDVKNELTVEFKDWKMGGGVPDEMFVAESPPEASSPSEHPKHALEGKEAPQFSLPLVGGGMLDLAAHRGKDIVILNFWATWCPPCRMELPLLTKVAADYKDKGVVLYGINSSEDEQTIQSFLQSEKLSLTVALDKDSKIAREYLAEYIPQTVVIGKDGIVKKIHVGLTPTYEEDLRKELDGLVK